MNEITPDTPISRRARALPSAPSSSATHRDELGLEPRKFLISVHPSAPTTLSADTTHSVVSIVTERARRVQARPSLVGLARDGHMTLTRAVSVRARVAESPDEIEAAKHLIRRRYAWRGYDMPEHEQDAVQEAFAPESSQVVFVASCDGATVGTITLGLDRRTGLLAESSYPEAIEEHRALGGKVCEVTRLAVDENADSKRVLAALFSLTWAAASVNGVTHMFVEVNPRHVVFYKRILGFVVAAEERYCDRVNAPSVLLCVDMVQLEERLIRMNAKVASLESEAQAA